MPIKQKRLSLRLSVHPLFNLLGCVLKIRTTKMGHSLVPVFPAGLARATPRKMSFPLSQLSLASQRPKQQSGRRRWQMWCVKDIALCWEAGKAACSLERHSTEGWIDSTGPSDCFRECSTAGTASTGYQDPFSLNEKRVGAGACFRDERQHSSISWAKQIIHYMHLVSWEPFSCLHPCPL